MTSLKEKKIFDGYDHNQIEKYSFKYEDVENVVLKIKEKYLSGTLKYSDFDEIFGNFQDEIKCKNCKEIMIFPKLIGLLPNTKISNYCSDCVNNIENRK